MTARPTNRLIHEASPYLRQHAHNPVDWFPWGEEAFSRARAENKPIFLSIGYSTCHWCHVMERESFENAAIAEFLNDHFVCIKVDREERPDLDAIYMMAVQATTGAGGWPMSVWLTPDLKPFFCGTYFPPDARYGRPGFGQLLERIAAAWQGQPQNVRQQADQITATLRQQLAGDVGAAAQTGLPDPAAFAAGLRQFASAYDAEHGGFGDAPKFPRPAVFNFLLRCHLRSLEGERPREPQPQQAVIPSSRGILEVGSGAGHTTQIATDDSGVSRTRLPRQARDDSRGSEAASMVLHTLRRMGEGGLFDQLGGGFHRYSVDERWLVSHFEKMLYDQGQLLASYIDAWQLTGDAFYADIARRTGEYVLRDLLSSAGGFYAAEDADSEGVEGKFYVWTRAEVAAVLGGAGYDDVAVDIFSHGFGIESAGNWEHGQNVAYQALTLEQLGKMFHRPEPEIAALLAAGRERLLAVRSDRVRPHRDEKIITAWNGLMIAAFARAAQALPAPAFLAAAQRAARFILGQHYRDGRLGRTATVAGMVDDYAFFANALLDLYETDFDAHWLVTARALADRMVADFHDAAAGGFFTTDGRDASVIIRAKEEYDGAEPSGNSVAALLLLRLASFTGEAAYRDRAEGTLRLFRARLEEAPHAVPQLLCALDWALGPVREIVIAGSPDRADTRALLEVVGRRYLPNKVLLLADGGERQAALARWLPFVAALKPIDGRAAAYVCVNQTCRQPVTEPAELAQLL